jgi:hypothetical protein
MAHLEAIQTKRQQAVTEDMRQAKLLYQLAQAEGKPYRPEAYFTTALPVRESVLSTPEVARELSRETLLSDAKSYWYSSPCLTREQVEKAAACESTKESPKEPRS